MDRGYQLEKANCLPIRTLVPNMKQHITESVLNYCPNPGQVCQRIVGLQYVKTSLIMQVDSDVVFPEDTLTSVVEHLLKSGPGNVFSPQIRSNQQTAVIFGRSVYIKMLNFISDGQYEIPSMRLTKAGVPIIGTEPGGVDFDKTSVDWLNGVKAYWASDAIRVKEPLNNSSIQIGRTTLVMTQAFCSCGWAVNRAYCWFFCFLF